MGDVDTNGSYTNTYENTRISTFSNTRSIYYPYSYCNIFKPDLHYYRNSIINRYADLNNANLNHNTLPYSDSSHYRDRHSR